MSVCRFASSPLCRSALDVPATTGLAAQAALDREHAAAQFALIALQREAQAIDGRDMAALAGDTQVIAMPGIVGDRIETLATHVFE